MKNSINIRHADYADYRIIKNYDEFLGDRRLDMQQGSLIVADKGEAKAVGFAKIAPVNCFGWPLVEVLMVQPEYLRRGIGVALLDHVKNNFGFLKLFISTEESNQIMLQLLSTIQAEEVGHLNGLNLSGERERIFRLI